MLKDLLDYRPEYSLMSRYLCRVIAIISKYYKLKYI